MAHFAASLGFTPLDLDDATKWRKPQDMIKYVKRYLRSAPGSPYVHVTPLSLHKLAKSIADRAGNSFLVASATAQALVARRVTVDPEALRLLPATIGEAFELDLARFEGIAGEQLRRILTALACGEGRGVPTAEWLAIAQALSEGDVTEADIERCSEEAAFYIVADEEFGVTVRRLYHEESTAHLRRDVDADREAEVAAALLNCVLTPRMGHPIWDSASSYVLAFYPKRVWRARRTGEMWELMSSASWVKCKLDRFGDLALILSDIDLALDLARRAEPPDLNTIVRACAIYGRFAAPAPPLVIDVLAGLGQRARAELMAESIEFPLDRCQAFSLLAARYSDDHARAISCMRAAEHAARAIRGHYQTLALYWVVCAARAAGQSDAARRVSETIHRPLKGLSDSFVGADNVVPTGILDKKVALQVWGDDPGGAVDATFALPHWLFWADVLARTRGGRRAQANSRRSNPRAPGM